MKNCFSNLIRRLVIGRFTLVVFSLTFLVVSNIVLSPVYAQSVAIRVATNLRNSAFLGPDYDGNLVAFVVSEHQEGDTDLNGDGDNLDYVLHVHDVRNRTTTNLELASTVFHLDGDVLAFLVNEDAQDATDLNGDGDAIDQVAFVYDANTGLITNLGIGTGIESFGPHVKGNLVAIAIDELAQGSTDLNGDGDTIDMFVMHVHNVATRVTTNLELATSFVTLIDNGNLVAFPVPEYEQGQTDLNGDNDAFDTVLHVFDAMTGKITNVGMAVSYSLPKIQNEFVAFDVEEISQGEIDLNGDGDALDRVAFLYQFDIGEITNLGLASGNSIAISDGFVSVEVDEDEQGATDLNGDGDTLDRVNHIYDISTGSTTNLGLSSAGSLLDDGHLVFRVWESGEGFTDLNGDGDTNDVVLHIHDATTGLTSNLGITAEFDFQVTGNWLAFRAGESLQGNTDLNGDGDSADAVVHKYDIRNNALTNLGVSATSNGIQVDRFRIAIKVDESSQGGTDFNRDGDANDKVLHIHNSRFGTTANVGRAVEEFRLSHRAVAFDVPESAQGNTDLNGDGDAQDRVVHLAKGF